MLFRSDGASRGRDSFDGDNLQGAGVDLSSAPLPGMFLAINAMPNLAGREEVPLSVFVPANGQATISFTGVETFPGATNIYLRDDFTGSLIDLSVAESYTFTVTSDPASQGYGRLTLVFNNTVTAAKEKVTAVPSLNAWPNPAINAAELNIALQNFGTGKATIDMIDALGRVAYTQVISLTAGAKSHAIRLNAIPAGLYNVRATSSQTSLKTQVVVK